MSQKHSNVEIAQTKMLARRLAAARGVPTTLGVSYYARRFVYSVWRVATGPFRRSAEWLKQLFLSSECPHCFGGMADDTPSCRLCNGKGRITTHQQKTVKHGRALLDVRLRERRSPYFAGYTVLAVEGNLTLPLRWNSWDAWWLAMENGYLPLDEWPDIARQLAQYEMLHED